MINDPPLTSDLIVDDPTAENLKQLTVVEDLELKRWLGEGKVIFSPMHFNFSEQRYRKPG